MSDMTLLRIGIAIAGLFLIVAIFFIGRPKKPSQGKRVERDDSAPPRIEPSAGAGDDAAHDGDEPRTQVELKLDGSDNDLGKRATQDFDKIVSLYVAARAGNVLRGEDIVVAAEKVGLKFGHMNVFHRLIDNHPERGPVFSMANILQPGSFDMAGIRELETPAIAFFLTLPAPIPALDAWDMMLPVAKRMGELLDGVVLDDGRSVLNRQRETHLRDELRAYDRQHEAPPLSKTPKW